MKIQSALRRDLLVRAAAPAESEDLDYGLREVEAVGNLPRDTFKVKKITLDVLHRLAARTDKVVMRFEISIHTQGGRMRRDLAQEASLHEETEIVVNGSQRNRRDSLLHSRIDLLWRVMPVRRDDRLVHYLALVRRGEAGLPGKIAELLVGKPHQ